MCKHCDHILIGFAIKHVPEACPLMAAFYCTFCASYGHKAATCSRRPDASCWPARPAVPALAAAIAQGCVLGVDGDDRAMRAFLYSKSVSIAGKTEALQDRICEWAGANGYISVDFK